MAPAKPLGSLSYEGAMRRTSPNKEVFSPTVSSVITELEAVQCTIKPTESLVDVVSKLTAEVSHHNNNISFRHEIKDMHSHIEAPKGPVISTFLGSDAS
jgi:hypothetical protein